MGHDRQLSSKRKFPHLLPASDTNLLRVPSQPLPIPIIVSKDKHRRNSRQTIQHISLPNIAAMNQIFRPLRQQQLHRRRGHFRFTVRIAENPDNHNRRPYVDGTSESAVTFSPPCRCLSRSFAITAAGKIALSARTSPPSPTICRIRLLLVSRKLIPRHDEHRLHFPDRAIRHRQLKFITQIRHIPNPPQNRRRLRRPNKINRQSRITFDTNALDPLNERFGNCHALFNTEKFPLIRIHADSHDQLIKQFDPTPNDVQMSKRDRVELPGKHCDLSWPVRHAILHPRLAAALVRRFPQVYSIHNTIDIPAASSV